jgi:hypothetical protein
MFVFPDIDVHLLAQPRIVHCLSLAALTPASQARQAVAGFDLAAFERERVLRAADRALALEPRTLTSVRNPRSLGGPHDFSSEGDYWWPDPKHPEGPYIRRDGLSNPDNFTAHRQLMMEFAQAVGALAAAYDLTHDERYAEAALRQLRAWFAAPETRMNPSLQYAQAIKGVATGRGIGVIDTLHLAEVALAVEALRGSPSMAPGEEALIRGWFREYLSWLTTHPYGLAEAAEKNNHGASWTLQAAAFARLTGNMAVLQDCRRRLLEQHLAGHLAADGSLPLEMARTKAYGYSLFDLEVLCGTAVLLSTHDEDLMAWKLPDGRGLGKAVAFMVPFLQDKSRWPKKPDVMYWDEWPQRQPALLFAALSSGNADWLALWKRLPVDSPVEEVRRNFPVRYPTLWLRHLK